MKKYEHTGLKMTPQRMAILDYLDNNKSHPSAEDIFSEVRKKYPMMSFATVYNTLERLKKKGSITELTIDPERKRYDPETLHHHHLICIRCKKIVDVRKEFSIEIPEGETSSFEVIGNHVEFYGICLECRKKGGR